MPFDIRTTLHYDKEKFLRYLEGMRGYSLLTVRSYDNALTQMIHLSEIVEEEGILTINLTPLRLHIIPLKAKSIAAKLSAIRSFITYLRTTKTVQLYGDSAIKIPQTLPKPIPHDHIMRAIEQANGEEKLMIFLIYSMGLRIAELSHLNVADVGNQWCRVKGKGGKERDIPMLPQVYTLFQTMREDHGTYVFESGGKRCSESHLRYRLSRAFSRVGLAVTPHQLRHSYATELLNHGARIADVSELLGHKSMASTQIYTKLGNALKMDQYQYAHPLCQKK